MEFTKCAELSRMTGGVLTEEYIRAACHRHGGNPLPHLECGERRPRIKVEVGEFWDWFEKERKSYV